MPESRAEAEARAEKEGFPKSNIYCLDGDSKCYIAPKGITSTAAKRAYAEARDNGDDKETAARKAWAVEKNVEESRNMSDKLEQRSGFYRYDNRRDITICNVRNVRFTPIVEDSEKGKKLIVHAYPILFNTPTIIRDEEGEYEEIVYPSAFENYDFRGVKFLGGHDINTILGIVGIGGTEAGTDNTGVFLKSDLGYPNTQEARDWFNKIEKGLVDGMSWGFRCFDRIINKRREIRNKVELFEFSATAFPAYFEASIVAARSILEPKQGQPKLTFTQALKELKEIK